MIVRSAQVVAIMQLQHVEKRRDFMEIKIYASKLVLEFGFSGGKEG